MTHHWVATGGLLFTRDFGESFSVFLAAHNAHDFRTFVLQDMSTDVDATSHPFLYIHQPSFVARVVSFGLQHLGLGIPANMALNLIVVTTLLWVLANALSKLMPWPVIAGAVFLAASSYAVFHENAVDLTRAPAYFAVFVGLAAVGTDARLERVGPRIAVASAATVAAATDFAVCVFVLYVVGVFHLWLSRPRRWRSLVLYLILPSGLFYGFYFGTVMAIVGPSFFTMDMLFSYLGRSGQFLASLGWIPRLPHTSEAIRRAYQEAGVVLWQRAVHAFTPWDLILSIGSAWKRELSLVVTVAVGTGVASSFVAVVARSRRWWAVGSASALAVVGCAGFRWPLLIMIVVPISFIFAACAFGREDEKNRDGSVLWELSEGDWNAVAITSISTMGLVATASIFPEYGISFLIRQQRGLPSPLPEMFGFGLIVGIGERLIRLGIKADMPNLGRRIAAAGTGAAIVLVGAGHVLGANLRVYRRSPPEAPPYASVLSRPEFKHQSFITTSFYGQVWYFTRGWAFMVPNPPEKPFAEYWELRHVRDWADTAKYGAPHYFLCDNTRLRGYSPSLPSFVKCSTDRSCNCNDVAEYMVGRGYRPVVVRPDFAIVDVEGDRSDR
jgi:hypothetical protein